MASTTPETTVSVGLLIAAIAIEGAFGQMFKLRKRSAYPGVIFQQLSAAPDVESAVAQALPVKTAASPAFFERVVQIRV